MHSKFAKPHTVMLIDDSLFDLKIVSRIISHAGYFHHIITYSNAKDALQYLSENVENDEKLPQLIFLDIQMPEMNGFQFMESYALLSPSFRQKCIVAMLSSTDDVLDAAKAKDNPHIITLLKKPLHPAVLAKLMDDYFDSGSPAYSVA